MATVTDSFESPGTIKSKTRTVLSSKVVGQILTLPVREGDRVREGELLVEIEGRDASAQLRRAQAAEAEARLLERTVTVEIEGRHVGVGAFASERILVSA